MINDIILALIGGVLLGSAAVILMATRGRVLGVSGFVSNLFEPKAPNWMSSLLFLAGLLLAPIFYMLVTGDQLEVVVTNNLGLQVIAGLLVGYGTALGSGCTSGHGVCGISRWSIRSIVATCTFMAGGVITVFVARHLIGGAL